MRDRSLQGVQQGQKQALTLKQHEQPYPETKPSCNYFGLRTFSARGRGMADIFRLSDAISNHCDYSVLRNRITRNECPAFKRSRNIHLPPDRGHLTAKTVALMVVVETYGFSPIDIFTPLLNLCLKHRLRSREQRGFG